MLSVPCFLVGIVLLRCSEGSGYDPTDHIYPWPLPKDRQPLFFSLITSFSETFDSSGIVPGVNVALDIINSNESNLLNGYSLHYILSDSKCQKATALDAFFHQILSETQYQKLAIIGSGCSPATEATAEISYQFSITQLSCASASPVLSDRRRFRKYFQLLPSMVDIAFAYVGVFEYYNWKQVTLIVQEENIFTEMVKQLKDLLARQEIMLNFSEHTFSSSIGLSDLSVELFTVPSERIYLIATHENYARELLCKAFHLGIRYPTHLLLTFHWYEEKWWLKENEGSDVSLTCTAEERESILVHSLAFNFILPPGHLKSQNVTTDAEISGQEYLTKECGHLGTAPYYFNQSLYAQYCFDATLTLAHALNQTLTDVIDVHNSDTNTRLASAYGLPNGTLFHLEDFNYRSDALTNITFGHLSNTSFKGITGDVLFDENGIRTTSHPSVYQFRAIDGGDLRWVKIGAFVMDEGSDEYALDNQTGNTLNASWPSGVPFDGVPDKDIATTFIPLVVGINIFAAAGVIFSIVCLAFNCIFRNKKLIRLSSPKLNIITVFGVIILYISMVLFAIPTHSKSVIHGLCIARLWFLALGVSLAFGTIIMKMFRVYIIFTNPTPKRKKFLRDWMLAVGVLIMVIIDLLVLIIFTAVAGGLNLKLVEVVPHKENPQTVTGEVRHVTEHYIHICRSTYERIAVAILAVYKGLLQLAALILAILTQRIKIKGLNEAKFIILAVYASSLGLILATLTTFTVIEYENVHAVLFAIALGFSGTAILGLLFIPKMIGLHKDPKGENVFSNSVTRDVGSLLNVGTTSPLQQQQQREIQLSTEETLRRRIKQLENLLSTYTQTRNESLAKSASDFTKTNGEQYGLGVSDLEDKDSEIKTAV